MMGLSKKGLSLMMEMVFQYEWKKVPLLLINNFMDRKILVWNCQGAASKSFRRVVKLLIDIHKSCMLVLLEPRISGIKAELLIHFLKFHHSHKVEALGYSSGIWILWNDIWSVWVLINHR